MTQKTQRLSLIIKAVGASCNLKCSYCFFNEMEQSKPTVMQDEVLEKLIQESLEYASINTFMWHGGEPLLAGIPFYRRAIELQQRFANGNQMTNYLQTNLTLVDQEWSRFFKDNNFKIGVSIDGPKHVHDLHRVNLSGESCFDATIRGLEVLRKDAITPGSISVITSKSLPFLRDTLDFLYRDLSIKYIAFNSFDATGSSSPEGFALTQDEHLTSLMTCFEYWLEKDDPEFGIREIDEFIAGAAGLAPNSCGYVGRCYEFVSVDNLGSVYSCERLSPAWFFGNIMSGSLEEVLTGAAYQHFVCQQTRELPSDCMSCEYLNGCHNGCTSFRQALTPQHVQGLYGYCSARKQMYSHIKETFGDSLPQQVKKMTSVPITG